MERSKAMLANVVRIMGLLMRRINDNPDLATQPPESETIARLIKRGFKTEEIEMACRWVATLFDKYPVNTHAAGSVQVQSGDTPVDAEPRSQRLPSFPRLLHELEACRLSPGARGELLQLLAQGLVDLNMVEQVIEFILRSDLRQVSRLRLKIILGHLGYVQARPDSWRLSPRVPMPQYIN